MPEETKIDPNTPVKLQVSKGRTVPGTSQYSSERADYTLEVTTTMGSVEAVRTALESQIEGWLPKMPGAAQPSPAQPPAHTPPAPPTPSPAKPAPTPAPVGNEPWSFFKINQVLGDFSKDMAVKDEGEYFSIKPKAFLGSENFAKIASAVRNAGGEYISAGRDSHFRIYKKKAVLG